MNTNEETRPNKGCLFGLLSLLVGGTPAVKEQPKSPKEDADSLKLSRRGPLLSKAEIRFEAALLDAIEPGHRVFAKVRLGDLFIVRGGPEATGMRNRINQKHVDFAIVDRETLRLRAGVELDDRSHHSERAKAADAVKDEAFAAAGVPLVRITAARSYDVAELKRRLGAVL